jgi:hypothetical protein
MAVELSTLIKNSQLGFSGLETSNRKGGREVGSSSVALAMIGRAEEWNANQWAASMLLMETAVEESFSGPVHPVRSFTSDTLSNVRVIQDVSERAL